MLPAQIQNTADFYNARVAQAVAFNDLATASRMVEQGLRLDPNHRGLRAWQAELNARGRPAPATFAGTTFPATIPLAQETQVVTAAPATFAPAPAPVRVAATVPENAMAQARQLIGMGRLASGANAYRNILTVAPNDLDARTALANTHYWRGQWREAQSEFVNVLGADPGNLPARLGYIRTLHASGRATTAWQQATALDHFGGGRDAETGLLLANIVSAVDADDQARPLASRPTADADVARQQAVFLGKRLIARGQRDQGLALVNQWYAAHPQDYDAVTDMAETLMAAGNIPQAKEFYAHAATLAPQRPEAPLGLARAAFLAGRHAESGQLYQQVAQRTPESLDAWINVGRLAHINGNKALAWQALDYAARLAPGSAHAHDARTTLAFQTNDRERFQSAVNAWGTEQPGDTRPDLWAQKWNHAHGLPVDTALLERSLDSLNPAASSEALKLINQHAKAGGTVRMPGAPTAELAMASQAKVSNQLTLLQPAIVGLAFGHEWSVLNDTTGAGAKLPDWQETYAAAFWGQPLGHTLSLDVRRFERFGLEAYQLLGGWGYEFNPDWSVRLSGGGAASGSFIPKWRVGAGATRNFGPNFSALLDVNYLSYVDANSWQLVPGLSWQWHPQWTTTLKGYATRTDLAAGGSNHSLSGALGTTWQFHPKAALQLGYTIGGENGANQVRNLIGENGFQGVSAELKWNLTEKLTLMPEYRFETHEKFDLHTFAVGLQLRY